MSDIHIKCNEPDAGRTRNIHVKKIKSDGITILMCFVDSEINRVDITTIYGSTTIIGSEIKDFYEMVDKMKTITNDPPVCVPSHSD